MASRGESLILNSVTRLFLIFGHLQHWKVVQKQNNFAKVCPKFCQTLNNPSPTWRRFISFCQSGEISPNLITLILNPMSSMSIWMDGWTPKRNKIDYDRNVSENRNFGGTDDDNNNNDCGNNQRRIGLVWLSWQSGCFRYQKYAVRIRSLA